MALFKFTKAILANKPIQVFNYGKHRRDFTYIDDLVEGLIRVLDRPAAPNPNGVEKVHILPLVKLHGEFIISATTTQST